MNRFTRDGIARRVFFGLPLIAACFLPSILSAQSCPPCIAKPDIDVSERKVDTVPQLLTWAEMQNRASTGKLGESEEREQEQNQVVTQQRLTNAVRGGCRLPVRQDREEIAEKAIVPEPSPIVDTIPLMVFPCRNPWSVLMDCSGSFSDSSIASEILPNEPLKVSEVNLGSESLETMVPQSPAVDEPSSATVVRNCRLPLPREGQEVAEVLICSEGKDEPAPNASEDIVNESILDSSPVRSSPESPWQTLITDSSFFVGWNSMNTDIAPVCCWRHANNSSEKTVETAAEPVEAVIVEVEEPASSERLPQEAGVEPGIR